MTGMMKSTTRDRIKHSGMDSPRLYVLDKGRTRYLSRPKKRGIPSFAKIFFSISILYLIFSFSMGGYQVWKLKQQINALQEEQKILLQQQQSLRKDMESLNDPEIIERIARESLGMVKPGETIVFPAVPGKNVP